MSNPEDDSRRLHLLLNRLPALIGYWDRDLRNVFANNAYVEYFGIAPDDARGRHIREILGEEVFALNLPYIAGVLAGEEQLFERSLIDQYGATRYTQACYIPDIVDGEVQGFFVQVADVTVRVEAERARDEAMKLFEVSMVNAPFGKAVLTTSAQVLQINPALCALLGYAARDLVGTDFRDVVHPGDRPAAETDLVGLLDGSVAAIASERRYVRRDGTTIWLQRNAVLVPGVHGGEAVIVAQFQDVTGRRHADNELARLALTDPLTGLYNRHAFTERIAMCRRANPDAAVGVIFVDLDSFKHVNDTHGHIAGDTVLVHAARLLARIVEPPNSAYRLGGDEFVVLVPETVIETEVAALADLIRAILTDTYPTTAAPVTLSASVGWTWGPTSDAEVLLRLADADMYRQKPNRVRRGD